MNEVVIPLKLSGVAALKAELKDLKNQMADAVNPDAFAALADRAGEVTKKINSINSAVSEFKQGSNLDQVKNSFTGMSDALANMDFSAAAKESANLKQSIGALKPEDLTKQFQGFISTIKNVGGAFLKLGMTILANPIFLIVAAVVAIIAVVALVLKSFGVLDDVIKALMAPINALIAGFKAMTDWLGLTAFAAEDAAAKSAKAWEEGSVAINNSLEIATSAIDRQIAEQKALGKNTYDLEVKRTYIVQWAAQQRLKLAKEAYYRELALGDAADQEKLKKLKAQLFTENQMILNAKSGRQVLINTKLTGDLEKPVKISTPKPVREKKIKVKDTGGDDIQKEIDKAIQANIDATLDAIEVEKNAVNAKYADLIAKAVKYKKDTKDLEILQMNEINNINLKDAAANKVIDDAAKEKAKEDAAEAIALEDAKYLEIQRITAANEQDKVKQIQLTKDYEKAVLLTEFDEKIANLKEGDALLIQLQKELTDNLAQINKDAADKELALIKENEEKKRAAQFKTANDALDYAANTISAIEGISNLAMENKLKKVKKGSKEEEALLKKQFQLNKSMQLAGAIVDAGKAITATLSASPLTVLGVPNPGAIAALAFTAVTSATNIAKIASTSFTSSTTPSTDTPPSLTAVAPSGPNLFGQANTGSQVNAGGGTNNNITVTAVVSETEITASQSHINNIQQNSVL